MLLRLKYAIQKEPKRSQSITIGGRGLHFFRAKFLENICISRYYFFIVFSPKISLQNSLGVRTFFMACGSPTQYHFTVRRIDGNCYDKFVLDFLFVMLSKHACTKTEPAAVETMLLK